MTSFTVYDQDIYRKFGTIAKEMHGHGGINKLLWKFIEKTVREHDGQKNGLENYFDQNFIPVPQITDDFETKIIPYIRTLNDDGLTNVIKNLHRGSLFANALRDTPSDQRRTVEFDYMTIWRKYR
ncbi:MAG: hypothetical protein KGI28_01590 [Thaumarchaeota archaeon]|nr:hypothetical protein [Nitrososphaerota archaeon]